MYCPSCATENEDYARACVECGALLTGDAGGSGADRPPPVARAGAHASDERTWGMFCHLLAFSGFLIPFGSIIGPLVMWLVKRDESAYVDYHGKESLNFQISVLIYAICCIPLCFLLIGFLLLVALGIFAVVVVILAAVRANEGEYYRYPLCIRFLR